MTNSEPEPHTKKKKKYRSPKRQAWLSDMRKKTGFEDNWLNKQADMSRKLSLHTPNGLLDGKILRFGLFNLYLNTQAGEEKAVDKIDILCMATQSNYCVVRLTFEIDEELRAKKLLPERDPEKRYKVPDSMLETKEESLCFTLLDGTRFLAIPIVSSDYSIYVRFPGDNGRHLVVFKHGLHDICQVGKDQT